MSTTFVSTPSATFCFKSSTIVMLLTVTTSLSVRRLHSITTSLLLLSRQACMHIYFNTSCVILSASLLRFNSFCHLLFQLICCLSFPPRYAHPPQKIRRGSDRPLKSGWYMEVIKERHSSISPLPPFKIEVIARPLLQKCRLFCHIRRELWCQWFTLSPTRHAPG